PAGEVHAATPGKGSGGLLEEDGRHGCFFGVDPQGARIYTNATTIRQICPLTGAFSHFFPRQMGYSSTDLLLPFLICRRNPILLWLGEMVTMHLSVQSRHHYSRWQRNRIRP